jgi:uncharacterized protein YdeI (YjbR/CyaY-like superfamily)
MKPVFFASPEEMRAWLAENHAEARELWVGFHKRATGRPSVPALQKRFRAERKAWAFWQTLPPWRRRAITHWVSSAKKEETREKRSAKLVADSARGRTLLPLERRGE